MDSTVEWKGTTVTDITRTGTSTLSICIRPQSESTYNTPGNEMMNAISSERNRKRYYKDTTQV
jgi:hypothetical protein